MEKIYKLKEYLTNKYLTNINDMNSYHFTPVRMALNEENCKELNHIIELCKDAKLYTTIRSEKGTILRTDHRTKVKNRYSYYITKTNASVKLIVMIQECSWNFIIGNNKVENYEFSGSRSFQYFKYHCSKYGVNLDDYIIDNGKEVKETIEKPLIQIMPNAMHRELENVHHIDFHSSYPSGLINTHPEFKPIIEDIYQKKENSEKNSKEYNYYKGMLNCTIGYMQSLHCCGAKWAHLSRDAIKDNNDRLINLAYTLEMAGRRIIGFNTDGIWYQGEIYHDENEGPSLGQWANDHVNCKFRAKSNGTYEFIEDGKYYPVVRGLTTLDREKKRSEWQWGDIYKSGSIISFIYDDETQQIKYLEENE